MLFSSQPFLLIFLPLALVFYYGFAGYRTVRLAAILAMSLAFYAWWDARFVPLLIALDRARRSSQPGKAVIT